MTDLNSGIYIIENTINGKMYVGSSVSLNKRQVQHFYNLRENKHHNVKLQNAFNKYGESVFIFSVLEHVVVDADLITREQYWIDKLQVCEFGYNLSVKAGAPMSGLKHSGATRQRMSETRQNMSIETKLKMSKSGKGRKFTAETKFKMSLAASNRTEEVKLRAGNNKQKAVICSNGLEFKSIKEAVNWLRLAGNPKASGSSISAVLQGRFAQTYGFGWKYKSGVSND